MHILIATDGVLDPKRAADAVARWYEDGDTVTVMTVANVPSEFLRQLGDSGVKAASQIALEAGQTLGAGDRAAEHLAWSLPPAPQPRVDNPVLQSMATTAHKRTKPVVDALKERGIAAKSTWRTTENRTAHTVMSAIKELDIDLLVIGSHGQGRHEGQLGSSGTKLVRFAPCNVIVLRAPQGSR